MQCVFPCDLPPGEALLLTDGREIYVDHYTRRAGRTMMSGFEMTGMILTLCQTYSVPFKSLHCPQIAMQTSARARVGGFPPQTGALFPCCFSCPPFPVASTAMEHSERGTECVASPCRRVPASAQYVEEVHTEHASGGLGGSGTAQPHYWVPACALRAGAIHSTCPYRTSAAPHTCSAWDPLRRP